MRRIIRSRAWQRLKEALSLILLIVIVTSIFAP